MMHPSKTRYTISYNPLLSDCNCGESEKFVKMKNSKMNKQAKKDMKNIKTVLVTKEGEDEYTIENILAELGETKSSKKSNTRAMKRKPGPKRKPKIGPAASKKGTETKSAVNTMASSEADSITCCVNKFVIARGTVLSNLECRRSRAR